MQRSKVANFKVSPESFASYFRDERCGRVYDPSFGRAQGRVVTALQEADATRRYADLHAWLAEAMVRLSLLSWTAAIGAFVGAYIGVVPSTLLGLAIGTLIALPFIQNGYANRRLRSLREEFWQDIASGRTAPPMSKAEQVSRGYRPSRRQVLLTIPFIGLWFAYSIFVLLAKAGFDARISQFLGFAWNSEIASRLLILAICVGAAVMFARQFRTKRSPEVKGLPESLHR